MRKFGSWRLVGICVLIVVTIFGIWELVQRAFFPDADPKVLHNIALLRGITGAFITSFWAVWFVVRSKERYERKLEESEEKYRAIIECMQDGVVFIDNKNKIALSNNAVEKIRTVKDNVGKPLEACHPERTYKDLARKIDELKSGGLDRKHPVFSSDDRVYENTYSPVKDSKGKALGVVLVSRDITERKRLEQQIIQSEKLAGIGQLAAGVAHELNNPLASISAYSEELVDWVKESGDNGQRDTEKIFKYLETIQKQSYRCREITQSLLNFARKTEVNLQKTDLNNLIKETVDLILSDAKKKNIDVKKLLEPNLPEIMTDVLKLQQVILNILTNALDAIESQGTIKVATGKRNNSLYFTISDTGRGIDEREMAKIFDPFYTTKSNGQGTGLGLSICYGILQELNGEIDVKSTAGKGTVMNVSIPV
jgi:PAS domain S-box-containing protein